MTLVATCSCGAKFQAKDELAGHRVKCPACGQPFRVVKPQTFVQAIHVTCPCGQALAAKAELAGKRVKCPACGQPLVVAHPDFATDAVKRDNAPDDPLGLGDADDDPLGLGTSATADPLGVDTLPGPSTSAYLPSPSAPAQARRPMSNRRRLVLIAGWIAIGFGGYQALVNGVRILRLLVFVVRLNSLAALFSLFGFVVPLLFFALGVWLCKLGSDMVRNVTPRESLERAAQASMVYIALFILSVIGIGFGLVGLLGAGGQLAGILMGMLVLSLILQFIYIIPPAIILYIDSRLNR